MSESAVPGGRDAAVVALASGSSQSAAAELAGVDVSTVRRWSHDPEFRDLLANARTEFRRRSMDRLVALNTKALDRLEALLDDPETPPAVLARLIDMTLGQSLRWVEVEELRERVERLTVDASDDIAARVREALRPVDDAA